MAEIITVTNEGPILLTTTYWQSALARAGKFFLTLNAGAFRLLLPPQHTGVLRDIRTAHEVVVSRGPMTLAGQTLPDMLELLFDDGSASPFSLHLSPGQVDHLPLDRDTMGTWVCTVWQHLVKERGRQVWEGPCYYRRSPRLPDLRPWPHDLDAEART
jgi:hypothetical protein